MMFKALLGFHQNRVAGCPRLTSELTASVRTPHPDSQATRVLCRRVRALRTALLFTLTAATIAFAGELAPKDVVAQLYKAYGTEQSPAGETRLFTRYFDDELLKLYLKDKREAKGEVGRLDGDPLYNAQEIQITDFSISEPQPSSADHSSLVVVRFKNIGKPTRVEYILHRIADGWKISDIRYDDGTSLKKILQTPL